MIDVAANVAVIRARMSAAAERVGRNAAEILLVAAAKQKSAAMVDAAIAAGVTDIGENYVQEAAAKQRVVSGVARWHMIGHLQRNKAGRAVEIFEVIETVDSPALGAALARHGTASHAPIRVLLEVNLAGEASKTGVSAAALPELVERLRQLSGLRVEGLMTVPPPASPEATRRYFRRLRELRDQLQLRELSMGMSDDFEVAIEEGATIVRVGRAIFGGRVDG